VRACVRTLASVATIGPLLQATQATHWVNADAKII
jgi:hypothetical protein